MTRDRPAWLLAGAGLAVVIAVQLYCLCELRAIGRKLDALEVPEDVVAQEIEQLRARLAGLERKATRSERSRKAAMPPPVK